VWAEWLLEGNRPQRPFGAGDLLLYLDLQGDFMANVEFGYGIQVGSHAPQFFQAEEPRQEDLTFNRFLAGMEKVRARAADRYWVLHDGGFLQSRLRRLAERHPPREDEMLPEDVASRLVDLAALLRRAYYFPLTSISAGDVLKAFAAALGLSMPEGVPQTEAAFAQWADEHGWRDPDAAAELATAAEEIGVAPAQLLRTEDLALVCYRMHVARRHPVWLALVRLYQQERLALLKTAAEALQEMVEPVP
jgi:hypothetical protein